jgi:hypothetical protein
MKPSLCAIWKRLKLPSHTHSEKKKKRNREEDSHARGRQKKRRQGKRKVINVIAQRGKQWIQKKEG